MSEELKLASDAIRLAKDLKEENDRLIHNNLILTQALELSIDLIGNLKPDYRILSQIQIIRSCLASQR